MHNNRPSNMIEALQRASSFLSDAGIKEPTFIAEYLIRSYLNYDRTQFVLELTSSIEEPAWNGIFRWLERAASGEPIQYIVGKQEFYGESFDVAPGVLIPRPETELLIEQVLSVGDSLWQDQDIIRIIDLGTGSGAIPITIAKQRPQWHIWALDVSEDALMQARANADKLEVNERVRFLQGNMLTLRESLGDVLPSRPFHIIISNPPYIPSAEIATLQREVRDHEPILALDGGEDGLDFYRAITAQITEFLNSPGVVAFEVGIGQDEAVAQLLTEAGAKQTEVYLDFQGIGRVVLGYF